MSDQRTHPASGSAIQSLLQAEMDAATAVETARLKAARALEAAGVRAVEIQAAAERRIRRLHSGSKQSREKILQQAQQLQADRLAGLRASWKVDEAAAASAVLEFARSLIGGDRSAGDA
ncbi:MAG: hypothetical protein KGK44_06130 [Gammaproteobacteria bacterium]|nr:hypothetical protein [Gammaproteobacteria bacterium]